MDIKKIAALAHLEITDEEVKLYTPQMANIVAYVEQLDELDTEKIEASVGGLTTDGEKTTTIRKDEVKGSIGQEKALDQAPSSIDGHFQVPKVL